MTERDPSVPAGVREVLAVAQGVLSDLDLEVVLERVVQAARELSGASYAALGLLDRSRQNLERFITVGIDQPERGRIGAWPRGRGVLGELIVNPVPLRLADIGTHPRFCGFPAEHPPMKTFLGVPVIAGGQAFGNLYLTEKTGGEEFSEQDLEAVLALADLAGVAIDRARGVSDLEAQVPG